MFTFSNIFKILLQLFHITVGPTNRELIFLKLCFEFHEFDYNIQIEFQRFSTIYSLFREKFVKLTIKNLMKFNGFLISRKFSYSTIPWILKV